MLFSAELLTATIHATSQNKSDFLTTS